jgi:flagellar assembly protein FliH
MAVVRKFEFDNSFDVRPKPAAAPVEPAPAAQPEPPPPPPTFSREELDAARGAAWIEGKMAGETETRDSISNRAAAACERLAASLAEAAASQDRAIEAIERQAAETLLVLVRKLVPALLDRSGTEEIGVLLRETFAQTLDQPRIIVRCAPDLAAEIGPLVDAAASRAGYDGRTNLISDTTLGARDCRIEWSEGGVERSPQRMIELVDGEIARILAAVDTTGTDDIADETPDEETQDE